MFKVFGISFHLEYSKLAEQTIFALPGLVAPGTYAVYLGLENLGALSFTSLTKIVKLTAEARGSVGLESWATNVR